MADIVYRGIVDILKAPDGDRFVVVGEHSSENLIYDPTFLGFERSPDFILLQVTSTVGNEPTSKFAFYRFIADELKAKLNVRPDDIMINFVFVKRELASGSVAAPPSHRTIAVEAASSHRWRDALSHGNE